MEDSTSCLAGAHQISTIDHHGNQHESTAYNISSYRTSCRTCKDMEVEEYDKYNAKKTYKRGSLLNVPNTGFSKINKKSNTTFASTIKPTKPSIDIEKARKMLDEAKGKVAPMPRYNVAQLKKISLDQLIKLILLL